MKRRTRASLRSRRQAEGLDPVDEIKQSERREEADSLDSDELGQSRTKARRPNESLMPVPEDVGSIVFPVQVRDSREITSEDEWLSCAHPDPMLKYLESIGIVGNHPLCWRLAGAFLDQTDYLVDLEE